METGDFRKVHQGRYATQNTKGHCAAGNTMTNTGMYNNTYRYTDNNPRYNHHRTNTIVIQTQVSCIQVMQHECTGITCRYNTQV
jgi:hypothetical protein